MSEKQNEFIFTVDQKGKVIRVQNKEYKDVEVFASLNYEDSLTLKLTINPSFDIEGDSKTEMYLNEGKIYDTRPDHDKPIIPGSRPL